MVGLWERLLQEVWGRADGITGSAGVGAVGLLTAAAVLVGVGSPGLRPDISNVGAWLGSETVGLVVHVNGLSGRPDGRVMLRGVNGHPLRVVQRGGAAYVVDETTGQVSRIDPSQLDVAQTRGYGAAGLQVVAGSDVTYVIDPARGLVQRIDPESLATIGQPALLTSPLGQAALDGQDTLWVPVPAAGQVVPVRAGRTGTPVSVGRPGDPLALTIAGGAPVVTDAARPASTVVGPAGGRLTVNLPSALATPAPPGLLAPASTGGPLVPVLAPSSGSLALVDTSRGALSTVSLDVPGDQLGSPQVLGQRVYVPDQTTGSLIVYDSAAGQFDSRISVTGRAGQLEVFTQGGQLWVNDENGATAAVVGSDGSVHMIGKYDTRVPGPRPAGPPVGPPAPRAPVAVPQRPTPTPPLPTPTPTTSATPAPAPSATPPPPPLAPATVTPASGAGWIRVTFTPSSKGSPTGYALLGAPAGATVQPAQAPAAGPYTFQITGGSCANQYSFQVAALYPGGQVASSPTIPVRPCVAPSRPTGLGATKANHQVTLSWSAPASGGGSQVTYDLSWSGATSGNAPQLSGLTHLVTGLANGGSYTFTLTAVNGAGSGVPATTSATMTGSSMTYGTYNIVPGSFVNIRAQATSNSASVGTIPRGGSATVLCQVMGQHVTDNVNHNLQSSVWDRVGNGYVSDLYVQSPRSAAAAFSDPPLWQCT